MKLLTIGFCMPLTRCEIFIIFHDIILTNREEQLMARSAVNSVCIDLFKIAW